jgi:hypothetical protein
VPASSRSTRSNKLFEDIVFSTSPRLKTVDRSSNLEMLYV